MSINTQAIITLSILKCPSDFRDYVRLIKLFSANRLLIQFKRHDCNLKPENVLTFNVPTFELSASLTLPLDVFSVGWTLLVML